MDSNLTVEDIEEVRRKPYQRKAVSLPNRSVVTVWSDKKGAINLTVTKSPVTIKEADLEGVGDGNGNDPFAL